MTSRRPIIDKDVQLLAGIAATLRGDYDVEDEKWQGSPFAWSKTRPSRPVGKVGEQLVAGWCAAKGLDVTGAGDSECDRIIHGYRVEVKFSTLWKSGRHAFQQIRDQNYEYAVCLGVAPLDARCWVISKDLLLEHVIGHMGQHTGREGRDTAWLRIYPKPSEKWLAVCGGSLSSAYGILRGLPRGPHGATKGPLR